MKELVLGAFTQGQKRHTLAFKATSVALDELGLLLSSRVCVKFRRSASVRGFSVPLRIVLDFTVSMSEAWSPLAGSKVYVRNSVLAQPVPTLLAKDFESKTRAQHTSKLTRVGPVVGEVVQVAAMRYNHNVLL